MAETRERWASRPAFIMAAVGSAIGLGNVWRFPGVAFNNGGGAFFIPYFIALLTAGIPIMILEYGLGSRYQGGAPKAYKSLHPKWEWVGWWAILISFGISVYYCVILAWSWQYCWGCLQAVFTGELPWQAAQAGAYFEEIVLQASESDTTVGGFNVAAAVGLVLTWIVVWWCIAKGVHRVGKIVMITVPLPLLLLVALAIQGLTLDGAADGLAYYLTPNWDKLWDANTWIAAYGQVFFSLSVGWGILIAYASYQSKDSDVVNNAFMTSFANCGFSFLAGFAVFSTLGYLALMLNTPIADLKTTSFGLAFTSYPTAIATLPGGPHVQGLIGVAFFVMLLTLGIDSAFSLLEAAATAIYDKFRIQRDKLVIWLCVAACACGMIYCTGAGISWLDTTDNFLSTYSLPLVALVQTVILGWLIGSKKLKELQDDINRRSEMKAGVIWLWSLRIITPIGLAWSLVVVLRKLMEEGYSDYATSTLWIFGAAPALLLIVLGFVLMRMKGADDAD